MRSLLLSTFVLASLAPSASAQSILYAATVNDKETLARSAPSDSATWYPTNRLNRGASVQVLEELSNGWLKIVPPRGSFSWIDSRYVKRLDPKQPNWVVDIPAESRAPIFVGSEVQPDARHARLRT